MVLAFFAGFGLVPTSFDAASGTLRGARGHLAQPMLRTMPLVIPDRIWYTHLSVETVRCLHPSVAIPATNILNRRLVSGLC